MLWTVELEPGVHLATGPGDPPRTNDHALAATFESHSRAQIALLQLRNSYPWAQARVTLAPMRGIRGRVHDSGTLLPDFEAVRDKRMSELTPAQREDAQELWLREQVYWMPEYHKEHYEFLFRRLDEARAKSGG